MNALLHGHNSLERVVAVQQLDDQTIRRYQRIDGKISSSDVEFFPFFFLADPSILKSFPRKHWLKELDGSNYFKHIAAFSRWTEMWEAVRLAMTDAKSIQKKTVATYLDLDSIFLIANPVKQFLLQSGVTLFKGCAIDDISRLQIEISTLSSTGKPSKSLRKDDRILTIVLYEGDGWHRTLVSKKKSEPDMLREFIKTILEKDPDIIEGTKLHDFTIPYLMQRCALHEIECSLGRDGSGIRLGSEFPQKSLVSRQANIYEVSGRHLVDPLHLAQSYEFIRTEISEFSINNVLRFLGFDPLSETGESRHFGKEEIRGHQDRPKSSAFERAKTTEKLCRAFFPGLITLSQSIPLPLGSIIGSSSQSKIESVLLREYIREKHSIPKSTGDSLILDDPFDKYLTGVFDDIIQTDLSHIPPLIISSEKIKPKSDVLSAFPALLNGFLSLLGEKNREQENTDFDSEYNILQTVLSGFYPYLNSTWTLFSDHDEARRASSHISAVYKEIQKSLELHNCRILQVDGNSLFVTLPENITTGVHIKNLFARISSALPYDLEISAKKRFKRFMSFRRQNYVYLDDSSIMNFRGASLIPHNIEPFLVRFLHLFISQMLERSVKGMRTLYTSLRQTILNRKWTVFDFARNEILHQSLQEYEQGIAAGSRKPSGVYESIRRAKGYAAEGDQVYYYVSGTGSNIKVYENTKLAEEWDANFPDENSDFYLARLHEYVRRFDKFFTDNDFAKLFSTEDLFEFADQGMEIITVENSSTIDKESESARQPATGGQLADPDFKIWLDVHPS